MKSGYAQIVGVASPDKKVAHRKITPKVASLGLTHWFSILAGMKPIAH